MHEPLALLPGLATCVWPMTDDRCQFTRSGYSSSQASPQSLLVEFKSIVFPTRSCRSLFISTSCSVCRSLRVLSHCCSVCRSRCAMLSRSCFRRVLSASSSHWRHFTSPATQVARFSACTDSGADFTDLKPFEFQCGRHLPPSPLHLRSTADRAIFLPPSLGRGITRNKAHEVLTLYHLLRLRDRVKLDFKLTPGNLQLR